MAKTSPRKPAAPQQQPDFEVLDAPVATDEQSLVRQDSAAISSFMGGVVAFFTKAGALERAAQERLGTAKLTEQKFKDRTLITQVDDERIQTELRAAKLERKSIDEHWTITGIVSRFHKRLVGGRERGGVMADEAAEIHQQLHNDYTRRQQQIARDEEDRRRRVEEQRVREEQEREAARLDQEALDAEAASPTLSDREEAFVNGIMQRGLSPFEAAKAAQFKKPAAEADRLMAMPKIQQALDARKAAIAAREQAQAKREQPVNVAVDRVRPAVTRVGGGSDVTTWGGEVFDADAFLVAVLDPMTRMKLGIPADCVMINPVKLNEYARSLKEKMNTWPGVKAKSTTSTRSR